VKFRGKNNDASKAAASIQDVADAAKVSIATVSRVLNNPEVVSEVTAAKVREAIAKLGYVPNPFAQGLITRASRVLCFALPDMFGEFYSELIRGADAQAHQLGYHLLVSSEARGTPNSPQQAKSGLGLGLADGLAVMITEPGALAWQSTGDRSTPVVLIDVEVNQPGVDCVLVDNAVGTTQAVEHLLQNVKPDRLFFVGGPAENFDTRARADAFTAALVRCGHTPRPDQISFGRYDLAWGSDWFSKHLNPQYRTGLGVLAANDEIALGVLHAAEDANLSVPGDIKLVGFDDTRLASLVRPKLSSVRVPLTEVGAAAISLLAERIEDPDRETRRIRLDTTLVVRESSR
jgi:LacI family transcriptional regulator